MPTATFSVAAGADDQFMTRLGTSYPPTNTPTRTATVDYVQVVRNRQASNDWVVSVALLKWDTSSIPDDAVVTSASLVLAFYSNLQTADSRSVVGDYYAWTGSSNADHTNTAPTSPVLSVPMTSINTTGDTTFPLSDLTGISKTGFTYLRLHVSGGQPTGNNSVLFAAYEDATPAAPRLLVTYTTAGDLVGMTGI